VIRFNAWRPQSNVDLYIVVAALTSSHLYLKFYKFYTYYPTCYLKKICGKLFAVRSPRYNCITIVDIGYLNLWLQSVCNYSIIQWFNTKNTPNSASAELFQFRSPPVQRPHQPNLSLSRWTWYVETACETLSTELQPTKSPQANPTPRPISHSHTRHHGGHQQEGTTRLLSLE
jgi:hypothetical protein